MADQRVDVLIAGAGPAGSATAAFLAGAGLEVLVADRARFPRDKPCAEYMSPAAVRILDRLGVVPALEAHGGVPVTGTTVVGARGASLTGIFAQAGHRPFRSTGLSISRRILDAELVAAARARGATVLEETTVVEVVRRGGAIRGAVLRQASGRCRTVGADVTVGADGLHSTLARAFGGRRREPLRRWAFVAHMAGVTGLADRAELHLGRVGYAGLNPIGGGLTNVSLVVPRRLARRARGDATGFFHRELRRFERLAGLLRAARRASPVRAAGPFAVRSRHPAVPGGLLVGDAAEFFDPFTGEGIHAALRGAELASEAILAALGHQAPVPLEARRGYLRARRLVFGGKWIVERMIGYGMLSPALFDRAVGRIGRRPPMAHTMIGVTGDFVPPGEVLNPRFLARMFM